MSRVIIGSILVVIFVTALPFIRLAYKALKIKLNSYRDEVGKKFWKD